MNLAKQCHINIAPFEAKALNNALDFALALEVAPFAGIPKAKASQMIGQTKDAVARWRTWATLYHISREEQEMMATAFVH